MIITKTPFRVSFVGGGSDLEAFYSQYPGAVISTSINKYMYISSHSFFDNGKIRLKYSETETVANVDDIKHNVFREVLRKFHISGAVEISSNADVPQGTGLGSSSSFTVGLLHNLHTRQGRFVTKQQLAEEACNIEINVLGQPIGKQDQFAAAFGGLNLIKFNSDGSVNVESVHMPHSAYEALQENLLMFYTGNQREASSILAEQKQNMSAADKVATLRKMVDLVWEARDALGCQNLDEFGSILHKNWLLKQQLASGITTTRINELYDLAMKHGAVGGKLLGAGGGGFLLFYCQKAKQEKLKEALGLRELDFRFDSEGTKVVFAENE